MAITIVKQKKEYNYIPVSERESDNPVEFIFRPLKKEEKAKLEDKLVSINDDQTINIANASYVIGAFKLTVKDVKNLFDEEGNEVKPKFIHNQVDDNFINMLPDELIQEVGNVIIAVSKDPMNADLYLGNVNQEDISEKPKRQRRKTKEA